ncbi:beta-lactamase hydrolase-like protein [Candidatus Phycosocius bacilliformis]|uniref:Beta-lactamase hydrolase-like protein n=1 Tax=Candidatus Phycosocius bacilliformis TaxID=1445552 RepID=A0A2P2ECU6_9PROT|nr:TIGR01244 family sulfur transferase [Candidatus Phycosocius bacilliformis]GBF58883.1 beta-lactamase hydrolase-like protein [Candidatus Phycosocius bacilliformis]
MSAFRTITPTFSAAPQISEEDVTEAARQGFVAIICNRPDQEEPGQLPVAAIASACEKLGLQFTHIPIAGGIPEAAVGAMAAALASSKGPVLAYCRSGTRSTNLWALAQASQGAEPAHLIEAARHGGYDLSGLAPLLQQLSAKAAGH